MCGKTGENDCAQGEEYEGANQAGCGDGYRAIELPQEDQKTSKKQCRRDLKKNREDCNDLLYVPLLQTIESQLAKACDLT